MNNLKGISQSLQQMSISNNSISKPATPNLNENDNQLILKKNTLSRKISTVFKLKRLNKSIIRNSIINTIKGRNNSSKNFVQNTPKITKYSQETLKNSTRSVLNNIPRNLFSVSQFKNRSGILKITESLECVSIEDSQSNEKSDVLPNYLNPIINSDHDNEYIDR